MAAVSIGDVTASIKVSGLENSYSGKPLSQRGVEQGTNLFAKGYQAGNGSVAGNISSAQNCFRRRHAEYTKASVVVALIRFYQNYTSLEYIEKTLKEISGLIGQSINNIK